MDFKGQACLFSKIELPGGFAEVGYHARKASLLANASGKSFDDIVAMHKAGEGWGKIAHDNGLNLGKVVSTAHRSDHATSHAQNVHRKSSIHGRSATGFGRGHASTMKGVGRRSSVNSGRGP